MLFNPYAADSINESDETFVIIVFLSQQKIEFNAISLDATVDFLDLFNRRILLHKDVNKRLNSLFKSAERLGMCSSVQSG